MIGKIQHATASSPEGAKGLVKGVLACAFQNSRLLKGSILDNVRLGRPQATEAEVLAALKAA